jgi:hypothetical protein
VSYWPCAECHEMADIGSDWCSQAFKDHGRTFCSRDCLDGFEVRKSLDTRPKCARCEVPIEGFWDGARLIGDRLFCSDQCENRQKRGVRRPRPRS